MKKLPIAFAIAAITAGSAHAAVYSSETFEAGTVNYSINGVNNGTTSDSWFKLSDGSGVIEPSRALAGTGYDVGATTRIGIVANGDPTDITVGGVEPSGKHAVISTSANRSLTSNYAMTLATDGATSLGISFSYMFYALEDQTALGSAVLSYSALGDFSDGVQLASFGFGQEGSTVETPDYLTAAEETWYTLNMSFTEAGAGITFTDTAAIRFNRVGLVGLVSPDVTTNHITFFDDITVTGVIPEPTTAALLGLAGFGLLLRRRK